MPHQRPTPKGLLSIGVPVFLLLSVLSWSIFFRPINFSFNPDISATSQNAIDPTWLLLTNSAVDLVERRQIIRATWQKTYASPNFTIRFVIGEPEDFWMPVIQHETDTYSDIIIMPGFHDNYFNARHNKPIQFLKHVAEGNLGPQRWKFVSKIDGNSLINLHKLYQDFVASRLHTAEEKRIVIGHKLLKSGWEYPGGQLEILSWKLVEVLVDCWTANPIFDKDEGTLIGRILVECGQSYDEFVVLPNNLAFDYDPTVGDPNAWSHKVLPGSLNPHRLKDAETFLSVAAMFDKDGVVEI